MAWIDEFMASILKAEIANRFLPAPGAPTIVSFDSISLASKTTATPATQESDVVGGIETICTATGWKAKILWPEQKVKFYL
jgi:hypothetical protein